MINITEEEKYFVWLNSFPFLTKAKIKEMKEDLGSYKNIFLNANKESSYFKSKFSDGEVSKLFYASTDEFVTSLFKNLEAQGIGVLTNSTKGYERFFNEVAPMAGIDVLYYKGDVNLINSKCVSIVGTRKPDSYGRQVTEEFAKALATKGLIIVSGLAAGAATAGCCAQMIGFAVISFKDNGVGGLISQGLGTSMLQIGNIARKPIIWLAPTLTAAILGPISTVVLGMTNNAAGAGMGTAGLVGPINAWDTMSATTPHAELLAEIVGLYFVAPAVLSLIIHAIMRRAGWVKDGDMKLQR